MERRCSVSACARLYVSHVCPADVWPRPVKTLQSRNADAAPPVIRRLHRHRRVAGVTVKAAFVTADEPSIIRS